MIIVTGATGQLGKAVVERLVQTRPAGGIGVSVRDPERAQAFAERGVRVRRGDFAKPDELTAAFEGAEQVLVISPDKLGEEGRRLSRTAIETARAAGARRVLYTSHMGTHAESPFSDHAAIEAFLTGAGMRFTSLRHGFYAESALHLIGGGFDAGEIRAPEDGPVSWTARADLAEADAAILAEEGRLDDITPALTAPEAFTLADLAALASELTGREVKRVVVPDEEWVATKIAGGMPASVAETLLGIYRDARQGYFAEVDPTLEKLLGRRPRTMRDVLAGILKPVEAGRTKGRGPLGLCDGASFWQRGSVVSGGVG